MTRLAAPALLLSALLHSARDVGNLPGDIDPGSFDEGRKRTVSFSTASELRSVLGAAATSPSWADYLDEKTRNSNDLSDMPPEQDLGRVASSSSLP